MTKEERDLLMIDLTSRLLYGVKVETYWNFEDKKNKTFPVETLTYDMLGYYIGDDERNFRLNYRPFLRQMSNMTEEEKKIYMSKQTVIFDFKGNKLYVDNYNSLDYLNSIHVDYRGLIEKELAVKATEEMYK